MTNRINMYTKDPDELKSMVGWADDIDASEVGAAVMALCDMVKELRAEVKKLKADSGYSANVASMLANGIRPD